MTFPPTVSSPNDILVNYQLFAGNLKLLLDKGQFDTSPTQGWGKVGARLGQGLGQGPGKVRARLGQGWGKVWTKSKVRARSGQARSGQGSGKVGARSGQKARFGQGRGKLAAIPMYFTLITPPSLRLLSLIDPFITISLSIPLSPPPLSPYLPLYHVFLHILPSIFAIYSIFYLLSYPSDPSVSIPLSILPLFPYLSLYLFYLRPDVPLIIVGSHHRVAFRLEITSAPA